MKIHYYDLGRKVLFLDDNYNDVQGVLVSYPFNRTVDIRDNSTGKVYYGVKFGMIRSYIEELEN